jgi:hypothetical protein
MKVKDVDITSGGKYEFERKTRKKNITIPLDPTTVKMVNDKTRQFKMGRCELLRAMIEFACKNKQFEQLMEQL